MANVNVLLIDDEASVRTYLSSLVSRFGYEVEAVDCAATGLERLSHASYGMVIADICLPDVPVAAQWTQQLIAAAGQTPIVLVSGVPTPELEQLAKSGQIRAFLSKPFELAFIKNILQEVLR
jgi:two-component system response regulator PilR (NtrC family)